MAGKALLKTAGMHWCEKLLGEQWVAGVAWGLDLEVETLRAPMCLKAQAELMELGEQEEEAVRSKTQMKGAE
jgi:hypothetical protein